MEDMTMTAFIAAGLVKEDDSTMGLMQGLDEAQARAIADWLALAAGEAHLRWISMVQGRHVDIVTTREEAIARARASVKPHLPGIGD